MSPISITDDVVQTAVRDDDHARARLLEAAVPQLRGMVLARLATDPNRWNAAEDILQEVLVALADGLGRLETATAAGYFAFQSAIVTHKVMDHFRAHATARSARRVVDAGPDVSSVAPLLSILAATGPSPSSLAMRKETVAGLIDELGRLRESHRDVITLAVFDHLDTHEIGRRLDISRTSAANLLARAIEALRGRWAARRAREENPK